MNAMPETSHSLPAAELRYEEGLVDVFSELADLFGNPRSHGQIYGLLFTSLSPLTMEEIAARLAISKGSVSQGLRALEELGAVQRIREDGNRTAQYSAKMELKTLIRGFVAQRLIPRLRSSNSKLEAIAQVLTDIPPERAEEARWRHDRVAKWHTRAIQFIPLAEKLLGK